MNEEKDVWPPTPNGQASVPVIRPKRRLPRWASVLIGAVAGAVCPVALWILLMMGLLIYYSAGHVFGVNDKRVGSFILYLCNDLPASATLGLLVGGVLGAVSGRDKRESRL